MASLLLYNKSLLTDAGASLITLHHHPFASSSPHPAYRTAGWIFKPLLTSSLKIESRLYYKTRSLSPEDEAKLSPLY